MRQRYELHEHEWARIADHLPGRAGTVGKPAQDNRHFVNAVIWIARSGAPWRDLPERYGPWNSVWRRFRRWAQRGRWEQIFQSLAVDADLEELLIDSTTVRAHQHAAGAAKKTARPRRRRG